MGVTHTAWSAMIIRCEDKEDGEKDESVEWDEEVKEGDFNDRLTEQLFRHLVGLGGVTRYLNILTVSGVAPSIRYRSRVVRVSVHSASVRIWAIPLVTRSPFYTVRNIIFRTLNYMRLCLHAAYTSLRERGMEG
jgi:hypothetical protein